MNFKLGVGDKGVQRYVKLRREMVPRCMRMFMVEFYRQVTISTPVDTGRARWGWNCSIKAADLTVPDPGKYSRDASRASQTFSVTVITGNDSLYIANAVPYIGKLNEGYSRQAPARFVELSFENTADKLEKYISAKGYDSEE